MTGKNPADLKEIVSKWPDWGGRVYVTAPGEKYSTLGCSKIGGAPPPVAENPDFSDFEVWGTGDIAE